MKHQRTAHSARKPSPKGRRIHKRSAAEQRQVLARYERSGLSQQAFCRRHAVALSTLQYWRRRAREGQEASAPKFVEVPQRGVTVARTRSAELMFIELASGLRLEVSTGTDAQWLSGLLRALGAV